MMPIHFQRPTVKVWNEDEDDYVVINVEDFQEGVHKHYDGPEPEAAEPTPSPESSDLEAMKMADLDALIAQLGLSPDLKKLRKGEKVEALRAALDAGDE